MYRIQVWDDDAKIYGDAHVLFDNFGATGFKLASAADPATEFESGLEAVRTGDDLGSVADVVCCVLDVATGKRYFDAGDLPDDGAAEA